MTDQKTGKTHERRPIDRLALISAIAAVVGAGAAVAVFVFHTADWSPSTAATPANSSAGQTLSPAASSNSASATTPTADSAGPTPTVDGRSVAELTPLEGAGFIQVKGQDVRFPCPTNESDDTHRSVTYQLPTSYSQLTSGLTISGQADPEDTAGVEVYIQHRLDRLDRDNRVGAPIVLHQNASATFTRELGDAVAVTLQITCQTRDQVVVLKDPRLIH